MSSNKFTIKIYFITNLMVLILYYGCYYFYIFLLKFKLFVLLRSENCTILYKQNVILGSVCFRGCFDYEPNNQINPAKLFAFDARCLAAGNKISGSQNMESQNREKRGSSRLRLIRAALFWTAVPNRACGSSCGGFGKNPCAPASLTENFLFLFVRKKHPILCSCDSVKKE